MERLGSPPLLAPPPPRLPSPGPVRPATPCFPPRTAEGGEAVDGGDAVWHTLTVAEVGAELARIELPRYVAAFAE